MCVEEEKKLLFFSTLFYRCLDNKLKISTDLLLSNTSREVTSTSVFSFFSFSSPIFHFTLAKAGFGVGARWALQRAEGTTSAIMNRFSHCERAST